MANVENQLPQKRRLHYFVRVSYFSRISVISLIEYLPSFWRLIECNIDDKYLHSAENDSVVSSNGSTAACFEKLFIAYS